MSTPIFLSPLVSSSVLLLFSPPPPSQGNATGRGAKSVREYLEKNYSPEAVQTRDETVILAIKALLEVVQSGSKSMELAVMERGKKLEVSRPFSYHWPPTQRQLTSK